MSAPTLPQLLVSHWEAAPAVDAWAAAAAGLYVWGAWRVRGRWPALRTLAFMGGLAAIVLALQSGLSAYDDRLLSAHMVQHIILLLVAPLLILWGRPVMLALRALPRRGRRILDSTTQPLRVLGHWSVGLLTFYAVVIVPHIPAVYDATLSHPLVHELEHVAFLAGGLLFLWPLFGRPAGRGAVGSVAALCYVIAAMPSCALVGAYLNRATTVLYAPYAQAGRALGVSAVNEQQHAGAIMWVGAHLILTAVALWVLGSKLVAEERRQRVRDALEDRTRLAPSGHEGTALW
ncbi:MAG: cytochrome c oxidase assembly protein [Solirubrobacteraceae bacterium]